MKKTILLVDDEPDILFVISRILEKDGYKVISAESGEECLEKLKNTNPDLILLDVMMPGLDGWETCSRIKSDKKKSNIPIVMLTAKTSTEDKIKALEECGAKWHISKPIDRKSFLDTVKWILTNPPRRDI